MLLLIAVRQARGVGRKLTAQPCDLGPQIHFDWIRILLGGLRWKWLKLAFEREDLPALFLVLDLDWAHANR